MKVIRGNHRMLAVGYRDQRLNKLASRLQKPGDQTLAGPPPNSAILLNQTSQASKIALLERLIAVARLRFELKSERPERPRIPNYPTRPDGWTRSVRPSRRPRGRRTPRRNAHWGCMAEAISLRRRASGTRRARRPTWHSYVRPTSGGGR